MEMVSPTLTPLPQLGMLQRSNPLSALNCSPRGPPVVDGAVLAVGLDGLWRSKTGDGDLLCVVALMLCSLELARKGGGVVADDQVNLWVSIRIACDSIACSASWFGVVLVDVLPPRILL